MTDDGASRGPLVPRLISFAALVVLTVLCWKPWIPMVIAGDRSLRVAALRNAPDGVDPDYVAFLRMVADRVSRDEVIHLVIPPESVGRSYTWFVYRAEWTLAGHEIHPLHDPNDRQPRTTIESGDLVVLWNTTPARGSVDVLLREGRGILARRR